MDSQLAPGSPAERPEPPPRMTPALLIVRRAQLVHRRLVFAVRNEHRMGAIFASRAPAGNGPACGRPRASPRAATARRCRYGSVAGFCKRWRTREARRADGSRRAHDDGPLPPSVQAWRSPAGRCYERRRWPGADAGVPAREARGRPACGGGDARVCELANLLRLSPKPAEPEPKGTAGRL